MQVGNRAISVSIFQLIFSDSIGTLKSLVQKNYNYQNYRENFHWNTSSCQFCGMEFLCAKILESYKTRTRF